MLWKKNFVRVTLNMVVHLRYWFIIKLSLTNGKNLGRFWLAYNKNICFGFHGTTYICWLRALYQFQVRMWACSNTSSYWKGSWADVDWKYLTFFTKYKKLKELHLIMLAYWWRYVLMLRILSTYMSTHFPGHVYLFEFTPSLQNRKHLNWTTRKVRLEIQTHWTRPVIQLQHHCKRICIGRVSKVSVTIVWVGQLWKVRLLLEIENQLYMHTFK